MWAVLDQLKGPKNKGGLRFRQLDTKKKKNSQSKKDFNIKDMTELINTQPRSQGSFLPVTCERLG